jgi:hypothetical protein
VKSQWNHESHRRDGMSFNEYVEAATHQGNEIVPLAPESVWHTFVGLGDTSEVTRHKSANNLSSSKLALLSTSNAFADRPPHSHDQSLTTGLVLSFLASFVKGFRHGVLPPFIHWTQELHSIRIESLRCPRAERLSGASLTPFPKTGATSLR